MAVATRSRDRSRCCRRECTPDTVPSSGRQWGLGPTDTLLTVLTKPIRGLLERRTLAGRYAAVSVVNVINHQALLNLANSGWGWSGGQANVFAAVIAAIPGYFLSRQWVWKMQGAHSIRDEIAPFWILALVGLVVSTVLAEAADRLFETWFWVAGASLFGYFLVWILKFIILDRLFDRAAARRQEADSATAPTTTGTR